MNLADFIITSGKKRESIADSLDISRSYLSLLESGTKRPSLDLAVRIERLTSGAVPATSWVPEPEEDTPTSTREDDAA